jgi:8-hydroxy-5-deazaflavin:NADPH oxidoreductase
VRLSKKHEQVILGSRSKEKSERRVQEILTEKGRPQFLSEHLKAGTNQDAASDSEVIIVTVPFESAFETMQNIAGLFHEGQTVISAVAAVTRKDKEFLPIKSERSVSESFKDLLLPTVNIAAAFQTVPSGALYMEIPIDADVLVCCDLSVFSKVSEIVSSIDGLRPLYAGSLALSREVEGLTALLLNIQSRNKIRNPTFKVNSYSV